MDDESLAIDIKLKNTNRTITPLSTPNYNEIASGTSLNKNYIAFEIYIKHTPVDTLSVTIRQGTKVIYQEILNTAMHSVGKHEWNWDGFNNAGIFNTKLLKQSALTVDLTAVSGTQSKNKSLSIRGLYAEQDWVDVQIDRNSNKIEVELRTEIIDGGSNGIGESPPDDVQQSPAYKHYPASDLRRKNHVHLKALMI